MIGETSLSRREFLKFSGGSLLGAALPQFMNANSVFANQKGRVIYDYIDVYDVPSFSGKIIRQYWLDAILPITKVTLGDEEPAYNRVWYQIGNEGYAHSGGIQPVQTVVNPPVYGIPEGGQLAEVTVPYTDALWSPGKSRRVAYRFYYETTHWVVGITQAPDNTPWYRVIDDKWDLVFYVPAQHLRLIPASELQTISPEVPFSEKRIEVLTEEQLVIAYEYNKPVFTAKAATGAEFSNGVFFTPTGRHYIFHKRPYRHMAAGNLARNGYDLPGIPWVCYITESGIAFHGTYWHNDYGRPRSHGCINLPSQASKWIFLWSTPVVPPEEQYAYDEDAGTAVDII